MHIDETLSGNRIERKKEETRRKIVSIAMALFKTQGFDGTSMEQIAREVDIAKGTLYNYFPVKEAIITEYIHCSFTDNQPRRIRHIRELPDTRARIIFILTELMEGVRTQSEIFEKYLTYQVQTMLSLRRENGIKSGFDELGAEVIILGQQSGEIRKDIPHEILLSLFGFAFIEVAQQFYMAPNCFSSRETIEQCTDLFINGAKSWR